MAGHTFIRMAPIVLLALLLFATAKPSHAEATVPPEGQRQITTVEFAEARIVNAARILSEMTRVNIAATQEAGEKQISLFLRDVSVHTAIDTICRASGLWYRFDKTTRSYLIMTVDEYKEDIVIYREDTTKVFNLRHQNVVTAALTIKNLYGTDRVKLSLETEDDDVLGKVGGGASASGKGSTTRTTRRGTAATGEGQQGSGQGGGALRSKEETPSPQQLEALGLSQSGDDLQVPAKAVQGLLSREPLIHLSINKLHNLLFVRTSDEAALAAIAELIRESDRPTPQVLLEMKILELTIDDSFRSQFNINLVAGNKAIPDGETDPQRRLQFNSGNFPLEGGTFAFSFIHKKILAQLELAEKENRVNVLATPMVLASNNREASLFIGEERPITTGISVVTTAGSTINTTVAEPQTEQRKVGDQLRITPRINGDRTVTLLIEHDASTVLPDNAEITTVNSAGNIVTAPVDTVQSATLNATVIAKDGLTVAVGGMIRRTQDRDLQKVPLLGDIPLLGYLFKRKADETVKREVVLLITPHIIMSPEESERISRERVAALSSNPAMDRYGFGASRNQPKLREGQTTEDFITLTRYAVQAAHGRPEPLDGVAAHPVSMVGAIALLPDADIDMTPRFSFQRNGLYVTAVLMENVAPRPVRFDQRQVLGNWLAATFEASTLAPAQTGGSRAYAYLLSDQPFLDVVASSQELLYSDQPQGTTVAR